VLQPWIKEIEAATAQPRKINGRKGHGQERSPDHAWHCPESRTCAVDVCLCHVDKLGCRFLHTPVAATVEHGAQVETVAAQDITGEYRFAQTRLSSPLHQQAGQADGQRGILRNGLPALAVDLRAAKQFQSREIGQPPGRAVMPHHLCKLRRTLTFQGFIPAIDHAVEPVDCQAMVIDGRCQRQNHFMAARRLRHDAVEGFAPPLQAYRSQDGFADPFGDAGQFKFEGMQGKERFTMLRGAIRSQK